MENINILSMNLQLLASENDEDNLSLEDKIIKMQEQLLKMDEIIEENKTLKANNEMLFNKNQEYFLKITGSVEEKKEEEINEYEEFVGKDFYSKLSNKEKKQLQIILEGDDE